MKTLFFLLISLNAFAQNEKSGVFLTFNDYMNSKFAYEINCATEEHTIRLNEFLDKPYIIVIHNGQKFKLAKDSIYGFISCDEPLVRFQDNEHYFLAEKGYVWIFYRNVQVQQGKTFVPLKKYFFSVKGDGKMVALSKDNLMKAFPDNHKFHDMLDAQFKNDNDIAEFDTFHKMYKVNHLLQQSSQ